LVLLLPVFASPLLHAVFCRVWNRMLPGNVMVQTAARKTGRKISLLCFGI